MVGRNAEGDWSDMRTHSALLVALAVVATLVPTSAATATATATVASQDPASVASLAPVVAPSRAVNVPLQVPATPPAGLSARSSTPDPQGAAASALAAEPPVTPSALDAVQFPAADAAGRVLSTQIDAATFQDIGLTWPDGQDGAALDPQVRTLTDDVWSEWSALEVSDEAPDAGTSDGRAQRGGTDLLWVGDVTAVQVSVLATDAAPGAELALVGADLSGTADATGVVEPASFVRAAAPVSTVPVDMITRAQWGAAPQACQPDVAAGGLVGAAVHHTATRNTYSTVAEAEQDIRNIQAYHIASRGWCDIGYNFLVDKWGNLYEGRANSLVQPVIGVHAGGFNTGTVGVSMLGDYTSITPSAATLAKVGLIIGVRLGVYGVDPTGTMSYATGVGENSRYTNQTVVLPRVFGHRDVAYTACPGNLGYPQLATIRQLAARAAVGLGPCPDDGSGYWLAGADGGVFAFCSAGYAGSLSTTPLARPVVTMAKTPSGGGYWLVASDGGVFSFGDAAFYGSTGAIRLNKPIVTAMATPSGRGYWLVASDGGVFTFGDAAFYGSTGAIKLNKPIVTAMTTPSGRGYWLVASDGGVFTFGDAAFSGSTGAMRLNQPIVTAMATPSGRGYWLIASDGGVFTFGDAVFRGSTGAIALMKPIVGAAATATGAGYWMVGSDGGVFTFGDAPFLGSVGNIPLGDPIVAMVRR